MEISSNAKRRYGTCVGCPAHVSGLLKRKPTARCCCKPQIDSAKLNLFLTLDASAGKCVRKGGAFEACCWLRLKSLETSKPAGVGALKPRSLKTSKLQLKTTKHSPVRENSNVHVSRLRGFTASAFVGKVTSGLCFKLFSSSPLVRSALNTLSTTVDWEYARCGRS